jgi:hypothetical protein
MNMDVKISELNQIKQWDSGDSPSGTDYYILYSHLKMKDVLFLNVYGSLMGWEYDRWYQVSVADFSSDVLDLFEKRPWNDKKQKMLNSIPKYIIKTPE